MNTSHYSYIAWLLLAASVCFFILGLTHPVMETGYGIGNFRISRDIIYLSTSFRYFFDAGEWFIGLLLLFFTLVFPIVKYIFLTLTLAGLQLGRHKTISQLLEIVNKWSMLDVFVVALLILNMKFDSVIIKSSLGSGVAWFAASVVALMACSRLVQLQTGRIKNTG